MSSTRRSSRSEVESPEELRCYAETERPTWIDIQGFGDEACLRDIGKIFGIHSLALADAVNVPQRAQTQRYPEHLLIIIHSVRFRRSARSTSQVCILLAKDYVVTFQERNFGFFDASGSVAQPRWILPPRRSGYLAYALVDALIVYYPLLAGSPKLRRDRGRPVQRASRLVSRVHRLQRRVTQLLRIIAAGRRRAPARPAIPRSSRRHRICFNGVGDRRQIWAASRRPGIGDRPMGASWPASAGGTR
jgi:Mg2+ and Co2+ transporter CorA